MKVENVKVFFRYEKQEVTIDGEKKLVRKVDGKIEAVAQNAETKETIATREVRLRHGDSPDKVLGRKYAFQKLMDHVMDNNIFPKPLVGELWKQFGSQCKQPNIKLAY